MIQKKSYETDSIITALFQICKVDDLTDKNSIQAFQKHIQTLSLLEEQDPFTEMGHFLDNITGIFIPAKTSLKYHLNQRDSEGNTLLHVACAALHPNIKILRILLEKNASINTNNLNGVTPFHLACANVTASFEVIQLLLYYRADPTLTDVFEQKNALHWACGDLERQASGSLILKLLLEKVRPSALTLKKDSYLSLFVKSLHFVENTLKIKLWDQEIETIHRMQKKGVILGSNIDGDSLNTFLRLACNQPEQTIDYPFIHFMLEKQADVAKKPLNKGETCLQLALKYHNAHLTLLFLFHGAPANLNNLDDYGRIPLILKKLILYLQNLNHIRSLPGTEKLEKDLVGAFFSIHHYRHINHPYKTQVVSLLSCLKYHPLWYQEEQYKKKQPQVFKLHKSIQFKILQEYLKAQKTIRLPILRFILLNTKMEMVLNFINQQIPNTKPKNPEINASTQTKKCHNFSYHF